MGNEKALVPDEAIGRHKDILYLGRVNRGDTGYWWRAVEGQEKPTPKFPIHSSFGTVLAYAIDEMIESTTEFGGTGGQNDGFGFNLMSTLRPVSTDYIKRFSAEDFDDSKKVGTVRLGKLVDLYKSLGISTAGPSEALYFIMDTDLTTEVSDDDREYSLPVGRSRHLVIKPSYGDFIIVPHNQDNCEWQSIRDVLYTRVEAADSLLYSTVCYMLGEKAEYYQNPEPVKTSIIDIKALIHEVNLALTKDTFKEVSKALPFTSVRKFLDSVAGTDTRVILENLWLDRGLATVTYYCDSDISIYKPRQ